MTENRHGLVVDTELTLTTGRAEREAALRMAGSVAAGSTIGADKAYDTADTVARLREIQITPHIALNITGHRGSTIDGRTTRHRDMQSASDVGSSSNRSLLAQDDRQHA